MGFLEGRFVSLEGKVGLVATHLGISPGRPVSARAVKSRPASRPHGGATALIPNGG